jgi:RNA polymerase sigma factor (TIGR02999 family)
LARLPAKSAGDVTCLLAAWTKGDEQALEQLIPLVYEELRHIAQYHWSTQWKGNTLQPTVLIHEAFLKMVGQGDKAFENRTHFFAVASTAMRQVLVNHAESSRTHKRGRGKSDLPLAEASAIFERQAREVLALNEALNRLQQVDSRKSRVVELRYFGGLSNDEIAETLKISAVTVSRDWNMARAWLARELGAGIAGPP